MENKNPQDVANMLANLLTPDVINKLLENKITAKKPTKKQYLEKLAENVTCFNTFIENIELEDDAIETLKQIGTVNFFSSTIINYISENEHIPIFCSCMKNGKRYQIYNGEKWEFKTPDAITTKLTTTIYLKLLKTLKIWENDNPNFLTNMELRDKWTEIINFLRMSIKFETDAEKVKNKKINNKIYNAIYNIHKDNY